MVRWALTCCLLGVLLTGFASSAGARLDRAAFQRAAPRGLPASKALKRAESFARLPLSFEANRGQFRGGVRFVARATGATIAVDARGPLVTLQAPAAKRAGRQTVVRLVFLGGRTVRARGMAPLPGRVNYLLGRDPQQWRRGVPTYGRVQLDQVYPGIDAVLYGRRSQLEYDFVVAPHADASAIRLRFEGGCSVRLNRNGDVLISTSSGVIRQRRPLSYQRIAGKRRLVTSRYSIDKAGSVRVELGRYDPSQPLVIDPVLPFYATYVGGSAAMSPGTSPSTAQATPT